MYYPSSENKGAMSLFLPMHIVGFPMRQLNCNVALEMLHVPLCQTELHDKAKLQQIIACHA